jgi:hypothetical protein
MDDRLRAALLGIIDAATRGTRYHRLVRGRVVNVLAGGNVETEPETAGTPPQPNLPLRYGLPGVLRAVVRSGARVLLGWAEGDPAQPFVAAWEASQLEELVFDVPGGARALARHEDTVDVGTIRVTAVPVPGMPPTTNLLFLYTPPTGAPMQFQVTGLPAGVAVSPTPGEFALVGKIAATSVVKA